MDGVRGGSASQETVQAILLKRNQGIGFIRISAQEICRIKSSGNFLKQNLAWTYMYSLVCRGKRSSHISRACWSLSV
jgi:hypothetical protein